MPDDDIDRDPDRILDRVCHLHADKAAAVFPPTDEGDVAVYENAVDVFEMLYVEGLDPGARANRLALENEFGPPGYDLGPSEIDWTWLKESRIDPDEYTYSEEIETDA